MVIQIVVAIHKPKIKVPTMVQMVQSVAVHAQQSKQNNWMYWKMHSAKRRNQRDIFESN